MNIHIKDEKLFDSIRENSIFEIEIGSSMYQLKNDNSDTDVLIIYINPISCRTSFNSHHQLQFKKNGTDYILTTLEQFVMNILSGDSTINYEVLCSSQFQNAFPELSDALSCYNYKVIKSYLGMAKRDLKTIRKKYNNKTASHFLRGLMFSEQMILRQNIFALSTHDFNILKQVKLGINTLSENDLKFYEEHMNNLRESLIEQKIDAVRLFEIETAMIKINETYDDYLFRDFSTIKYYIRALELNDFGYEEKK